MVASVFFTHFFFLPAQCARSLKPLGFLQFIERFRLALHLRLRGGFVTCCRIEPRPIAIRTSYELKVQI
jgi:hypothetical protein